MIRHITILFGVIATIAACGAPATQSTSSADLSVGAVTALPVSSWQMVPGAPAAGAYQMHVIDVGTGLSVLVRGADFTLLYDAGSNDDDKPVGTSAAGNQNRLLAYLYASVGPSGGPECVPQGDAWKYNPAQGTRTIDHLILSHAHEDHMSMMADVLHCYAVTNVWDPGAEYTSKEYKAFLAAVLAAKVSYHTVAKRSVAPLSVPFAENDVVELGAGALFKVLHADGALYPNDINRNSTALRLTLGAHAVLLAGDTEAGGRATPPSSEGGGEGALLANHASELAVDVLQVGHHGSETSSRAAFVDAVFPGDAPRFAVISAGPRSYSGVVLPDADIVSEYAGLAGRGVTLLRTDTHDASGCPTKDRIGMDDSSPAGCDNFVLTFD